MTGPGLWNPLLAAAADLAVVVFPLSLEEMTLLSALLSG